MPEHTATAPGQPSRLLLQGASAAVRKILVRERIAALGGNLAEALHALRNAYTLCLTDRSTVDCVCLGLLQAELLHLDFQHDAASQTFDEFVTPHLDGLTQEQGFTVEQNRNDLQCSRFAPNHAGDFYNLIDQKRNLNYDWLDYRDLFEAKQNAQRGKHNQVLPVLWQQLRRAYQHGCWQAMQWTSQLFAAECISLGNWEDAVYHTLICRDVGLIPDVAEGLLSARRVELVQQSIWRVIKTANLRSHFLVACKLLAAISDAIPDREVKGVADWLLPRASEVWTYPFGPNPFVAAWEVVKALAPRMPLESARIFISTATLHPAWTTKLADPNRVIPERETLIEAISRLISVVPREEIELVAFASLPLVLERHQLSDYPAAINLLCHLANRGGESTKTTIADALYPAGKPVHPILVSVAEVFGKGERFEVNQLRQFAQQVIQDIRLQVQRLSLGQEPEVPGERLFDFTAHWNGGVLKVYTTPRMGIHALCRQRAKLDELTVCDLVRASLALAQDRDNFCNNRASLLAALLEFRDVAPAAIIAEVVDAVEPLARGPVLESSAYQSAAEVANPLNPFKHETGSPDDVQGAAIIVLAAYASSSPTVAKRVAKILEEAVCDRRPSIRRAAYAAVRRVAAASDGVLLGLLAGLRDPDPAAAVSAFAALGSQTSWKLNRNQWRLFLLAARTGINSANVKLRANVAGALRALNSHCPDTFQADLQELLATLSQDVCASVREFAQLPSS